MSTTHVITTAEQLLHTPGLGRCELVRGALIAMNPAGFEHGRVVSRINSRIETFVDQHRLGITTGAETGFFIEQDPDTVRAPDVGFVRGDRVPKDTVRGFFRGAPDLAVEVLSPDDRAGEVLAKVQMWLAAGCRLVWVVDPQTQSVTAYDERQSVQMLSADSQLDGGEVLPGFSVSVAEIFAS